MIFKFEIWLDPTHHRKSKISSYFLKLKEKLIINYFKVHFIPLSTQNSLQGKHLVQKKATTTGRISARIIIVQKFYKQIIENIQKL